MNATIEYELEALSLFIDYCYNIRNCVRFIFEAQVIVD